MAVSMYYIPAVAMYLVVHIDWAVLEYMQTLAALDNWIQNSDWHIEQDNLVAKVVEGNLEVLCIVAGQVH